MSAKYSPIEIPNTEKRSLSSQFVGQEFSIYVGFPYGYQQTDKIYPVLYLLDANVTYSFIDLIRVFQLQRKIPEFLIVGIGYPVDNFLETDGLRQRDFTPTIDQETLEHDRESSGQDGPMMMAGAEKFLQFICQELKPFISASYRATEDDAAVFGTSYAGLFGLYAMFTEPGTFTKYVIGSPSIWWDSRIILSYEQNFAAQNSDLDATVFMYVGSHEAEPNIDDTVNLSAILDQRSYPKLRLKTEIFKGEDHMSVSFAALFKGLQNVY